MEKTLWIRCSSCLLQREVSIKHPKIQRHSQTLSETVSVIISFINSTKNKGEWEVYEFVLRLVVLKNLLFYPPARETESVDVCRMHVR